MIRSKNNQGRIDEVLEGIELSNGETLMQTLRRKKENKEVAPVIMDTFYTNKKDGVLNSLNIRADRFAIGIEQTERLSDYKQRKRKHLEKAGQGAPDPENPGVDVIG